MSDFPVGWTESTLGDLLVLKYGKALKKSDRLGGDVPVYGSNGEVGRHTEAITTGPTIVVGRKGSIGEVHFSPKPCFPIDTTYYVDEFPATSPHFTIEILKHLRLTEMNRATAIPGLNRNDAYERLCLLPPLAEQKRIVEKLDSLTTSSREAAAALISASNLLDDLRSETYIKAFNGKHKKLKIQEIASVGTGATPKRGTPKFYDNGTIPWVTSGAVNDKTVSTPTEYITETALAETNCKVFPTGSLLMAMYGEGKTRGKVARLEIDAATNQALAVIHSLDTKRVSPDFLYYFLDSTYIQIRKLAEGGVQPNLNLGKVNSLELPVPSLEEQENIVSKIKSTFLEIEILEQALVNVQNRLEALDRAMLDHAFKGKLVPQDPNEEPASTLLERIKSEKEAAAKIKPKRKPSKTPRAKKKRSTMTKSRFDDDVKGKPYLATILKDHKRACSAVYLYSQANLTVADFYKQLAFEVASEYIRDLGETLEAA